MKISYNWLKKYIDTTLSVDEISKVLTDIGLEVEGVEMIETVKGGLNGVVVGEVLTCEPHQDSDHLNITTVDYGQGAVQVVCGASNVRAGQKVVVATVGAVLYPDAAQEGIKIKKGKIRGVESLGMICAEDELGLGSSHDGIMVLPQDAVIGTPAKEYFNIQEEYIMEIGLTPNRVDAASHYGVARDLAAWASFMQRAERASLPSIEAFAVDNESKKVEIEVVDREACPRYMGVTVAGVKVADSPEWLQNALRAIGINPKNNIVDITNFILHEVGQPLHAFDLDKIEGGKVVVKCCEEGTKFKTLDGVERSLSANDLMICSAEKPMCIAGVFGGEDSGVTENTVNVFIESAYFNPVYVRKSAKRHGLSTDSSFRFERGVDPNMLPYALKRAALLMCELAGGTISSQIIDVAKEPIKDFEVEFSIDKCNRLIGKEIGAESIKRILSGLEIKVVSESGDKLTLAVPPYRVDVQREIDVIEDILRIYGYNSVEVPDAVRSTLTYNPKPDRDKIFNTMANLLSANGFNEIMSNSLSSSAYYDSCETYAESRCVKIVNPLSNDLNVMRQTLLFNALEAIELNTNRKNSDLKLYEFGNCYFLNENNSGENPLSRYKEEAHFAMTVTGLDSQTSWNGAKTQSTFFTMKAEAENMMLRFGINLAEAQYTPTNMDIYSQGVSLRVKGRDLMHMGVVSKKYRKRFDIKAEVYYLDINFDTLAEILKSDSLTVNDLSKFPEVKRDLALLVDKNVTFSELRTIAFKTEKKLLKSVTLFDVYEGDKLPDGKKSLALNFVLEDTTKTLTDGVIDKCMSSLIYQFERQAGATVRS